ncbi:hypothetical protein VNO77_23769 [Canavalia gladiata]|uniref:Uncharacterized protein n=1 Tax=Canavalia gladiata TaxID=3824 RepID=A0AAN9QC47_CANGL
MGLWGYRINAGTAPLWPHANWSGTFYHPESFLGIIRKGSLHLHPFFSLSYVTFTSTQLKTTALCYCKWHIFKVFTESSRAPRIDFEREK